MRSRVRAVVRDSAGTFVTDGQIDDWINEAYLDIVARERLLVAESSSTMGSAGTSVANGTVDFPADFISPLSLRLGTDDVEFVDDVTFWNRQDDASTPVNTLGRVFNDKIELYPKPTSGTAFRLRYVRKPTALSSGSDAPAIGEEYHRKLVDYAKAQALLKEGRELGVADRYRADYERDLAPLNPRSRMTPGPLTMRRELSVWDTEGRHI